MCNINIILNLAGQEKPEIAQAMNSMSFMSWQGNHDGEGYIALNKSGFISCKSEKKLKYSIGCYFISSHQRFSTSGKKDSGNAHPHSTKHLEVQHNGIFSGLGNGVRSDTAEFAGMLEKAYVKNQKDIKKAIREVCKEVSGSYSVVVYEKNTEKVFYFKDSNTSMHFIKDKSYLVMSTSRSNVEFAKWFLDLKGKIKAVKPHKIFDVLRGLEPVSNFKEKRKVCSNIQFEGYNFQDSKQSNFTGSDWSSDLWGEGDVDLAQKCECGHDRKTHQFAYTSQPTMCNVKDCACYKFKAKEVTR